MKMKRYAKNLGKLFLLLLLFVFILVCSALKWFLEDFGDVDISAAIYQILSPLKGTATNVWQEFMTKCMIPSVLITAVIILIYYCFDKLTDKLYLDVKFQIKNELYHYKKDYILSFRRKFRKIFKAVYCIGLTVVLIGYFCVSALEVQLPQYLRQLSESSEFIEQYYVAPESVTISFPQEKRNLIVIYMESMENTYASKEAGGAQDTDYIPELTRLAQEGVSFSHTELLGGASVLPGASFTIAALLAYQTGMTYKLPVDSAADYEEFLPGIKGMGEILAENGYRNYYMCGSDTTFGGRRNLYEQHGDYEIYDWLTAKEEEFIPEDYYVFWGMEDAKLYEYAKLHLEEIASGDEPFQLSILTVDTHFPDGYLCELCGSEHEGQYANVISCASRQVYEFIEWAKTQQWYDKTTFVIVGDHLSMSDEMAASSEGFDRRIYNCFYNLPEELQTDRMQNRGFNTMDFFPTMLASVGASIEGERLGLGTNLFAEKATLQEELGYQRLLEELSKFSEYYYDVFIMGNKE